MKHLPRTQEKVLVDHRDRLRQQERKAGKDARLTTEEVVTFSVVGDMEVRTSGKKRLRHGGQLVAVITTVTGAGTSDTIFDILLDGAALGSGVTYDDANTADQIDYLGDFRGPAGASVQIDFTQAGMHEGMVVDVIFKG